MPRVGDVDREPFTFRSKSSGYIAGVKECVSSRPPAGFAAYFGATPYVPGPSRHPTVAQPFFDRVLARCRRTDFESISWRRTTVPRPNVLPVRRLHRFRGSMIWYRECASCAGFASRWSRRSPENARNSKQRHPLPLGRPGQNRSALQARRGCPVSPTGFAAAPAAAAEAPRKRLTPK